MSPIATDRLLERTLGSLEALRSAALALERTHTSEIEAIEPQYRVSARNLLHYLGVRQRDIRNLQQDLASLGLSSLGVIESHALASLNAVIAMVERLMGAEPAEPPSPPVDMRTGPLLLRDHARTLLGPTRRMRSARIMVTMPSEAATNEQLLVDLMRAGMDVMRINCAHDDAAAWRQMVANLRSAERIVGRRCRIQADLAGPKLRTGAIGALGHFVRIKPARDRMGRTTKPAPVWLTPGECPEAPPPGAPTLPLPSELLDALEAGDSLGLTDLRGRERELAVLERRGRSWLAEANRTAYVAQEMGVKLVRGGVVLAESTIGALPAVAEPLLLAIGDTLVLTREDLPGMPAMRDGNGRVIAPAHVHCTLPAAFDHVAPGHRVWLDDGKIGGVVRVNDGSRIEIEISRAAPGGAKLRAEKGINFPDTELGLAALTDKDVADLAEVVKFADMVALSFLRTPEDVIQLEDRLHALGAGHLGIVLKIENAAAFRNLPRILLASLRSPPVGVMVARGDLAVEVGFERLSEVQEEILWLCEAAHVPVIWATQVLEGLAKAGAPTRAEVSDAVMSSRAECVMLNKGPRIVETVGFLADILNRMEEHHDKRMNLLRRLSVSEL